MVLKNTKIDSKKRKRTLSAGTVDLKKKQTAKPRFCNREWIEAFARNISNIGNAAHEDILIFEDGHQFNKIFDKETYSFDKICLVKNVAGLGMKMEGFTLDRMVDELGPEKQVGFIELNDAGNESGCQMKLIDFVRNFLGGSDKRVLNTLALECSRMTDCLSPPEIFRQKSMIRHLLADGTLNEDEKFMISLMENFIIVSVAKSFTDFHIDGGGTAAFFYVAKGEKTFLFMPPSEENLRAFTRYDIKNRKKCFAECREDSILRVTIKAGQMMFIPAGWIHCVYTSEDTIAYSGGIFSLASVEMHLRVFKYEDDANILSDNRIDYSEFIFWKYLEKFLLPQVEEFNRKKETMKTAMPIEWAAFKSIVKKLQIPNTSAIETEKAENLRKRARSGLRKQEKFQREQVGNLRKNVNQHAELLNVVSDDGPREDTDVDDEAMEARLEPPNKVEIQQRGGKNPEGIPSAEPQHGNGFFSKFKFSSIFNFFSKKS